jgi:hypothetical protein
MNKKVEKPKDFAQFTVQEGERDQMTGLLQDIRRLKEEQEQLQRLLNRPVQTEASEYKRYIWKDTAVLAKIFQKGDGFVLLQGQNPNEFYISVNGTLYKMPHLLYIQKVMRTKKFLLATDDLGVTYYLDDTDFLVKYLDTYIDDTNVYSLSKEELMKYPIKQVIIEDGTIYKQLADGVKIIHPDGTEEFIKGARLVKTKDGFQIIGEDGTVIKTLENIAAVQYPGTQAGISKEPIGELLIDGQLRPVYKDEKGYYYVDENGKKHYISSDDLMQLAKSIDEAQLIGYITDEYGNKIPIYKDANGYYYVDENGNKHYLEMTPELLNKLIDDNGYVMAMVDGKMRKIFRDENGYYYLDENGNKVYVPFDQLKNALTGSNVYMTDADKLVLSQLTDAQKKALDSIGEYSKIFLGADGNLYVQAKDGTIYRISPDGTITKLGKGELFVENGMIKMKTPDGKVTVLAGNNMLQMTDAQKRALASIGEYDTLYMDSEGNMYVRGADGNIYKIGKDGTITNMGKGELFVENGRIKMRLPDGTVKDLGKLMGNPVAFVYKNGKWYGIDAYGNEFEVSNEDMQKYLDQYGYVNAMVDGQMRKLYKDANGFFYLDENGNKHYVNPEALKRYLDTQAMATSATKFLGPGIEFMDTQGNRYFMNEKGEIIKISPDGTITNLGKGSLYVDENGNIIFEDMDGNKEILGFLDKVSLKPDTVFNINGKKYGISDDFLVEFDPANKKVNKIGKTGTLYFDKEGNLIFEDANGNIHKLGEVDSMFKEKNMLAELNPRDLFGEKLVIPEAEVSVIKKEEGPEEPEFLKEMRRRLEEQKKLEEQQAMARGRRPVESQTPGTRRQPEMMEEYPMQTIVEMKPTAYLDFVKIANESEFVKDSLIKLGNVAAINLPTGTVLEGYVMYGVLAPTYDNKGYDTYTYIKLDKNILLQNNIDIGTYDGILVAEAKGDLTLNRVIFSPFRISFYDDNDDRKSYYDGEFSLSDSGSGGSSDDFIRGSIISMWDGLEGLPGLLISRQDEISKWLISAGIFQSIGDTIQALTSPYNMLMGDDEDTERFRNISMGEGVQMGVASGISNAFAALTEYQIDIARRQFPIIAARGGNDPKYKVKVILPSPIRIKKVDVLEKEAIIPDLNESSIPKLKALINEYEQSKGTIIPAGTSSGTSTGIKK